MDKTNKKQIKKIVTWVLLAALVAGLAAMPLMAKTKAAANGPVATVHSGTVETGTVRTALHGGGTLTTEDVEEVTIPSGVKITEFLVKNGDTVTEGTPLAAVDKVSVMTAITEVTDTMEYLQTEMRDAKNEKVDSTISATAGGRVKKVFAQKGDSVQEVMLRDGALALLSLDGLMAVKIEKKLALPTGDTVTVTFPQGEEVTGRIASNLDGVIVITVEDEGYEIGQSVTVTKDGTEVGQGELYVHSAWTATAFSGTIQTVRAQDETKVSAGSTLFTLTDTDFQGTLDYLASLHREYEELMQALFKMYNSGTIDAPCDGTISGIDKDSVHLLGADEGHWQITLLDHAPVENFAAFAARVTEKTADTLTLAIDPELIRLETLHDLCHTEIDTAAMTRQRTYPADTAISVQNANGALVPGGTAQVGDILLFIGDEQGVVWVVDVEKSVPTTTYGVVLMMNQSPPESGATMSTCIPTIEKCPETNLNMHKSDCPKFCHDSANCDGKGDHYPTCIGSCSGGATCSGTGHHKLDCIKSCNKTKDGSCPGTLHHEPECIKSCKQGNELGVCTKDAKYPHYLNCVMSCIQSDGTKDCPATVHKKDCIEACIHKGEKDTKDCPATRHYADCIECCIKSESAEEVCPSAVHQDGCFFYKMTYTAKVAMVSEVGNTELVVRWDASDKEYVVEKVGTGWKFSTDQGFNMDLLVKQGTISVANPKNYQKGDVIFVVTGYRNKEAVWTGIPVYIRGAGKIDSNINTDGLNSTAGMSNMDLSALMGGLSGFGSYSFSVPSVVEEQQLFDLEGNILMTVSPQKTVSLTINLDEQDIAKVQLGQKATVKVEALGEELFEAQVTEIATRGVNSGGSSKFAVKLELPKAPNMLDGMSATASLPLEEQTQVPTIPVKALAEQGTQTVVYTALDEEGNPASPVPVTIGISDGITAEILEGLEVGDTYYYSYYDVLEENTGVEDRFTLS